MTARLVIGKRDFDAIIFDMDGVVTDTARVHFAAWKRLFDDWLVGATGPGVDTRPFTEDDYHKLVDGRSRLDGIVAFLADRGAHLESGTPADDPGDASVWALANRKNDLFLDALAAEPAEALASSVDIARAAERSGIDIALVTASRNRAAVLESAGLGSLFEVVVDGVVAAELGLPGRPDPAMFLEAARRLGVEPARAVIFEDALPGVAAARRGGFGLVIGVDRSGERTEEFISHGADDVVTDLAEVAVDGAPAMTEPATLTFGAFAPADEGRREALSTLANGVFGTRGAAPEARADGVHYPGTYAAGLFNRLTSIVDGVALEHESMVNLPNWLPLTFRPFDGVWLGEDGLHLSGRSQELDLLHGELRREFVVEDAEGRRTTVVERRIVSIAQPNLAGLVWYITPENWSGSIQVRSAVDGTVENRNVPDEIALEGRHIRVTDRGTSFPDEAWLCAETVQSRLRIAVATRTRLAADGGIQVEPSEWLPPDGVGLILTSPVEQGRTVVVEKTAALATSRDPAISEPLDASRVMLGDAPSFDRLARRHHLAWRQLWRDCRLLLESPDQEVSGILDLHVFHVLQTLSPNVIDRDVGVPARGLHGEAYRGHLFWDELFIFPFLDLRLPDLTRELLLYRYRRLDAARRNAAAEGHRGAMFPWQSGSDGREETPTQLWNQKKGAWMPDRSRRQRHVGLAVAHNVWQYLEVTGDTDFLVGYGAEMLIEIARFFESLAVDDADDGRFHIRGVMGPDEFQDGYPGDPGGGIDDNAYTNVLVSWLLRRAAEACDLLLRNHGESVLERLGVEQDELDRWDDVNRRLYVPFLDSGIIAQFSGFDELEELDWEAYRSKYGNIGRLDLILDAEGDSMNRYKASKQADALMLFYLFSADELTDLLAHMGYDFDPETIPETIDYYLARTTNGSSLSRVAHAWVLARADREASWALFREALQLDVADTQGGTTREGIHMGAMAGTIDIVQRCYTGIETIDGVLRFDPQLPSPLPRLTFAIQFRGHRLDVEVTHHRLRIRSGDSDAPPIRVALASELLDMKPGTTIERDLPL
ncbi:MAG: HAD-IA family hydrolase [Acidimicrobiia bacterium]